MPQNYDYDVMEVNSEGKSHSTSQGSFTASMSWGFIKATVSGSAKSTKDTATKKHHIVTKMSMERYYSSLDDTTATLTKDASSLIDKGDTVGFFQACGSGYIRSIRRTAEVTAVFTLESSTTTEASEFAASLKIKVFGRGGGGGSFSGQSNSFSSESKLSIHIKAFGLGLNMDGADTLVARSLEDYDNAIKFAFKSMQNDDVGMIRGIEVVPWMDNLQFQNAVHFIDLSYVADGADGADGTTPAGDGTAVAVPAEDTRSALEVKAITTINGEFLQMIDSIYRNNIYLLASMRRCIGELELLQQAKMGNKWLIDHTGFDMTAHIEGSGVTVDDVLAVVNGKTLTAKFQETETFITAFYGPCAEAMLKGSDQGRMVRYWFNYRKQCNPDCLRPNVKYSNVDGVINCEVATDVEAGSEKLKAKALTLEGVVEHFCMPEIDNLHGPADTPATE